MLQEKSVVVLLPIMDVTKLLLTTPGLRILITVRFDYLCVVFFSGFQQYTMSSSTTQVNTTQKILHGECTRLRNTVIHIYFVLLIL